MIRILLQALEANDKPACEQVVCGTRCTEEATVGRLFDPRGCDKDLSLTEPDIVSSCQEMEYERNLIRTQQTQGLMTSSSSFGSQAKLLAALANEKRLQILTIIMEKETGVNELASRVGLSQSALSQHLAKLRADELVTTRRDAQNVYYSSNHESVRKILELLIAIETASASTRRYG